MVCSIPAASAGSSTTLHRDALGASSRLFGASTSESARLRPLPPRQQPQQPTSFNFQRSLQFPAATPGAVGPGATTPPSDKSSNHDSVAESLRTSRSQRPRTPRDVNVPATEGVAPELNASLGDGGRRLEYGQGATHLSSSDSTLRAFGAATAFDDNAFGASAVGPKLAVPGTSRSPSPVGSGLLQSTAQLPSSSDGVAADANTVQLRRQRGLSSSAVHQRSSESARGQPKRAGSAPPLRSSSPSEAQGVKERSRSRSRRQRQRRRSDDSSVSSGGSSDRDDADDLSLEFDDGRKRTGGRRHRCSRRRHSCSRSHQWCCHRSTVDQHYAEQPVSGMGGLFGFHSWQPSPAPTLPPRAFASYPPPPPLQPSFPQATAAPQPQQPLAHAAYPPQYAASASARPWPSTSEPVARPSYQQGYAPQYSDPAYDPGYTRYTMFPPSVPDVTLTADHGAVGRLRALQRENEALYYSLSSWRDRHRTIRGAPSLDAGTENALSSWSKKFRRDKERLRNSLATSHLSRRMMQRDK